MKPVVNTKTRIKTGGKNWNDLETNRLTKTNSFIIIHLCDLVMQMIVLWSSKDIQLILSSHLLTLCCTPELFTLPLKLVVLQTDAGVDIYGWKKQLLVLEHSCCYGYLRVFINSRSNGFVDDSQIRFGSVFTWRHKWVEWSVSCLEWFHPILRGDWILSASCIVNVIVVSCWASNFDWQNWSFLYLSGYESFTVRFIQLTDLLITCSSSMACGIAVVLSNLKRMR